MKVEYVGQQNPHKIYVYNRKDGSVLMFRIKRPGKQWIPPDYIAVFTVTNYHKK